MMTEWQRGWTNQLILLLQYKNAITVILFISDPRNRRLLLVFYFFCSSTVTTIVLHIVVVVWLIPCSLLLQIEAQMKWQIMIRGLFLNELAIRSWWMNIKVHCTYRDVDRPIYVSLGSAHPEKEEWPTYWQPFQSIRNNKTIANPFPGCYTCFRYYCSAN